MNRRRFMKSCLWCAGAVGAGNLVSSCGKKDASPTDGTMPNEYVISLNNSANSVLRTPGNAMKFQVPNQSLPVIVIRLTETDVIALSSRCTHQGLEVDLPQGNLIHCTHHGSTFDLQGNRNGGPAPAGSRLVEVPSRLEGETIILTV